MLDGRYYFTHEDVQAVARGVLAHRLIVRPEAEVEGKQALDVVSELLATVPVLETGPRKLKR
jgi:MoxR-like ATPase